MMGMFGGHLHDSYAQVNAKCINIAESQERHNGEYVSRFDARKTVDVPTPWNPWGFPLLLQTV